MKTSLILSLCCATSGMQLTGMNICLMKDDGQQESRQKNATEDLAPQVKTSEEMQQLQGALKQLNILQYHQTGGYIHLREYYEVELAILELLAKQALEAAVRREAHFILGNYAYHGYKYHYAMRKPIGVNFKKALIHLKYVTDDIKLQQPGAESEQQAQAYFMMGKIHQHGESYFWGCRQTVKINHEAAEACFTLAHQHTNNKQLQDAITKALEELQQEA